MSYKYYKIKNSKPDNIKDKIKIKKVVYDDANLLLRIHNTAVKNGYFASKKIVKKKDHLNWFKQKLKSKKSYIFIGIFNNKKFGYVRFDEIKSKLYEVSIGNLPFFYGRGLGSIMLRSSIKKFSKIKNNVKIVSVVKKFNIRSEKCFLKNNFVKTKFNKIKHKTINSFNLMKDNYFEYKLNL